MTPSGDEQMYVEEFREYIEGAVAGDERYGAPVRWESADGSSLGSRFDIGGACWFEVLVQAEGPEVQVGLTASDPGRTEDIKAAMEEVEGDVSGWLRDSFAEAGLDWPEASLETSESKDGTFRAHTRLALDGLVELDTDEVRDQVVRMLEGYLIAFGPVLEPTEAFEPVDEDE